MSVLSDECPLGSTFATVDLYARRTAAADPDWTRPSRTAAAAATAVTLPTSPRCTSSTILSLPVVLVLPARPSLRQSSNFTRWICFVKFVIQKSNPSTTNRTVC